MRKLLSILFAAMAAITFTTSCSDNDEFNPENEKSDEVEVNTDRKILVAYFSGTGNTQRLANQIVEATGADVFRITAADPYSENPYDDSDRIQNESYNNLRPEAAEYPESVTDYDVIFIGSPIWWHNPAMVVCTFLEHYDLKDKIVVPFFTYGSTTYLQASINKIYESTPESTHLSTYTGGDVTTWLREINIIE